MKAAIIEDEQAISKQVGDLTKRFFQEKGREIFVSAYFIGRELVQDLENGYGYDFYLMDLSLPDIDGLELLGKIRENQKNAKIIIVSGYPERAVECIHSGIFDFVPKTKKLQSELNHALERILAEIEESKDGCYYLFKNKDVQKLFFDDIYYIEMVGRNAVFHCRDGQYSEYRPLKEIYSMLPEKDFIYINNGQVVNLWRVKQTSAEYVLLDNDVSLPISRRKRKDFTDKILQYYGRKR